MTAETGAELAADLTAAGKPQISPWPLAEETLLAHPELEVPLRHVPPGPACHGRGESAADGLRTSPPSSPRPEAPDATGRRTRRLHGRAPAMTSAPAARA